MPYFIDKERRQVLVRPPGSQPDEGQVVIDTDIAVAVHLAHGQVLTVPQMTAVLAGSPSAFLDASGPRVTAPAPTGHLLGAANTRPGSGARAHAVAGTVEVFAWVFLALSISVGLGIAFQTEINQFGQEEHRNVLGGLLVALAGSFQALVVIMVATYIRSRTEE